MAWKKVYVDGKGYRYTDGKGNYRLTNPEAKQTAKKALDAVYGVAQSAADNLNRIQGRPTKPKPKPTETPRPKPKGVSNIPPQESNAPVNVAARETKPVPPKATEQRTTTNKPSTPSKPSTTPKPVPKSSSKPASKTSETYKDGGKGLYQGSQEYRDKIGGSGNPLLNRLRRDMGRDEKTGEKPNAIPKNDSPASKRGSNSPTSASTPMTGGTPFNPRNRFETPEQRKLRLKREGRA